MDFSRPHVLESSVATKSNIRYIKVTSKSKKNKDSSLDDRLVEAANRAAKDLLLGPVSDFDPKYVNAALYPERVTPSSEIIEAGQLVVIFESFDNLNFVYATPKSIFSNRNGNFHHDDFIGKTFGCKIRSRCNRGYGFCYLLKPTPELWARSLNHRTQIVHELDASMICFYLNLKPNMLVCETGTGSGAMSHAIMRTIAPQGKLHTYEFNKTRADQARKEFEKNGLSHLVTVHHKDVCGKASLEKPDNETKASSKGEGSKANANKDMGGGFGLPGQTVSAVFLDLPEPWHAIPHAAFSLQPNGRIASYSPCVEQTQRTVVAMRKAGFHSIKTMEFRIRENYVDEVEYEPPPRDKRPRFPSATESGFLGSTLAQAAARAAAEDPGSEGEDTGAEADNEKSEMSETEADQLSLATAGTAEEMALMDAAMATMESVPNESNMKSPSKAVGTGNSKSSASKTNVTAGGGAASNTANPNNSNAGGGGGGGKRKKFMVARPFGQMRGHTAFLTFATSGNLSQPDPCQRN